MALACRFKSLKPQKREGGRLLEEGHVFDGPEVHADHAPPPPTHTNGSKAVELQYHRATLARSPFDPRSSLGCTVIRVRVHGINLIQRGRRLLEEGHVFDGPEVHADTSPQSSAHEHQP